MTIKSTSTHSSAASGATMLRRALTLGSGIILLLVAGWILVVAKYDPAQASAAGDVALVLAPVVAAAAAIERILETIFDLLETRASKVVAFLAQAESWIDYAESEATSAREKLIDVATKLNSGSIPLEPGKLQEHEQLVKGTLKVFEDRLERAESFLEGITVRSPTYRQAKRLASLYISVLLGLLIASIGSVQMLHLLGIFKGETAVAFDVLVTGVVMATGSGPVHSVINILQQGKEALESASGFLQARQSQPRVARPGE